MKKFFMLTAIAAVTFGLLGCEKDPQNDGTKPGGDPSKPSTEYTENLTFTLEVAEVEADQAKIKVEHNGTTKDTWYGFATTETDIEKAIEDILTEGNVTLKKTTKTTMTVRNLEPETEYTFVAVGITADGKTFSEPATVKFTTAAEEIPVPPTPTPGEYTINPNWTVTYIGDYEEGGKVYNHVITVETTDTNPYFVTAWPVEAFDQVGIATVVEEEIKAWEELLAQYPEATWADDILYAESILATVGIDPTYGTKWYAMAIGCDTNGKATGLYALSEVIDLENLGGEEEEPTAEYAAWLGDWTFTGANGVAFDVTMKQGKANQTYKLAGWEGPESEGLDITVEWMADQGIWVIFAQSFGTYSFGASGNGEIWLAPMILSTGYFYPADGIPACLGGTLEDGSMLVEGYSEEQEDGSVIAMETMMYLVNLEADGKWYNITSTKEWPTFPLTVTPATKATTNAVKEFKGGKKTLNPLAPKTFNTFSLCEMSIRTL